MQQYDKSRNQCTPINPSLFPSLFPSLAPSICPSLFPSQKQIYNINTRKSTCHQTMVIYHATEPSRKPNIVIVITQKIKWFGNVWEYRFLRDERPSLPGPGREPDEFDSWIEARFVAPLTLQTNPDTGAPTQDCTLFLACGVFLSAVRKSRHHSKRTQLDVTIKI